jgi:threonine/homoserine/homoserine lactone efflux protein
MLWARQGGQLDGKRDVIPSSSLARVFRQGFVTNVLNPKVALFFLAFLPQFINPDAPSKTLAFILLGFIFDFNGTVWNILVATVSARAATKIRNVGWFHRWIERTLGIIFIFVGVRLVVARPG